MYRYHMADGREPRAILGYTEITDVTDITDIIDMADGGGPRAISGDD